MIMDWYWMNLLSLGFFIGTMGFVVSIMKAAELIGTWIISHIRRLDRI